MSEDDYVHYFTMILKKAMSVFHLCPLNICSTVKIATSASAADVCCTKLLLKLGVQLLDGHILTLG